MQIELPETIQSRDGFEAALPMRNDNYRFVREGDRVAVQWVDRDNPGEVTFYLLPETRQVMIPDDFPAGHLVRLQQSLAGYKREQPRSKARRAISARIADFDGVAFDTLSNADLKKLVMVMAFKLGFVSQNEQGDLIIVIPRRWDSR